MPPVAGLARLRRELSARSRWAGVLDRIEWLLLGLGCTLLIGLHVVLFRHMGAFWRDEASSIHVARAQFFRQFWGSLVHDSFPALFDGLLKLWIWSGPGGSEIGLRLFGTLAGVGLVFAVIVACRLLDAENSNAPLLALALAGFNESVFYFGSSLRAYGLAASLSVLCLASFWRLVRSPGVHTAVAALLLALLSLHSNYQNCYLLFGTGVGGAVSCAARCRWKRATLVLAICCTAALSMLVYLPTIRSYQASTGFGTGMLTLSIDLLMHQAADVVSRGSPYLPALWSLLGLLALVALPARIIWDRRSPAQQAEPSLPMFCLTAGIVSLAAAATFFLHNGNFPHPWHFTPLVAFTAVLIDTGLRLPRHSVWLACPRILFAVAIVSVSLPVLGYTMHLRRTNIDLVLKTLEGRAGPADLVVVHPFWLVNSFDHYYTGHVDWITIPAFPKTELYDATGGGPIRKATCTRDALRPTLRRMAETLMRGKRVWIVGNMRLLPEGETPPDIGPAPDPHWGSGTDQYAWVWGLQSAYYLQHHARRAEVAHVPCGQPVSALEDVSLLSFEGWNDGTLR